MSLGGKESRVTKTLRATTFKARKSKMPKSSTPLIDAIPDATRKPWDICPNADCVSNTKCTYRHTDDYRETCGLYHPTCDCPSLEAIRTQSWIEQEIREMMRESSTDSRDRAPDPASFHLNGEDDQAGQTSEAVGAVYNHETCVTQAA